MSSVNMECVVFKALCQDIKFLQSIKRPLKSSVHDISYKVSKILNDSNWYIGADLWSDQAKAKQIYAILYALQRKELIVINKGNKRRQTTVSISDKGWNYIKQLKERA